MITERKTKITIVASWVFFVGFCGNIFLTLDQKQTDLLTRKNVFGGTATTTETKVSEHADQTMANHNAVKTFMNEFYGHIRENKIEALKEMVEDQKDLTSQHKIQKIRKYIKEYRDLDFVVENGADKNSYIVYATYRAKIKGISTPAPGLSRYYLVKNGTSFLIYNNENHFTSKMKNAWKLGLEKSNIKLLVKQTNEAYQRAIKSDSSLKHFFQKNEADK